MFSQLPLASQHPELSSSWIEDIPKEPGFYWFAYKETADWLDSWGKEGDTRIVTTIVQIEDETHVYGIDCECILPEEFLNSGRFYPIRLEPPNAPYQNDKSAT